MLPAVKQIKQHQVYFEKGDYDIMTQRYKQVDGGEKLSQEELLIAAKGFFIDGQFAQCLRVIKSINPRHSSKVLFERQSLHFRAQFLLKRHVIPNIDDLTIWRQILDLVNKQSSSVKGPPIQEHHLNIIKQYKDFLSLVEERLAQKIVIDEIFKQQKALEAKVKRYEGFPTYLISKLWVEDFNKTNSVKSEEEIYLSPINNFSIVNDVFENYHYEDLIDQYKNIMVFPGTGYITMSKRYWLYFHTLVNNGKQICPIKRLIKTTQSTIFDNKSKGLQTHPLIPLAITCDEQTIVFQLTHNKSLESEFYTLIQRKFGIGQFKIKSGDNWSICDLEGSTQIFFQGFRKILSYRKLKIPKNVPQEHLRPLLRFQFQLLPQEYLKDAQNGLKGLQNIGNSCYLNSCIQCLSNTQYLLYYFALTHSWEHINFDQKDGIVVTAFSDLIKGLWNKSINKISLYPKKFKKVFGQKNTQFRQKTQEDAHQFMLCLLNNLHQQLKIINSRLLRSVSKLQATTDQKRVKQYFEKHALESNKSIIMNIFRGKIHNTMNCKLCNTQSHSYDVFLALTLPLPQKQSKFIDIYFCGWETRETKKYRIHLHNIKTAEDMVGALKQAIKRKTEVQYEYIFGQINKQNLTFEELSVISTQKINILEAMNAEDLFQKVDKVYFILYQVKKKSQTQVLAFIDYRLQKNGLILGFPRLMLCLEKDLKDSNLFDFKRDIVMNDRQNYYRSFDILSISISRPKQNKPTPSNFDFIIQVIFSKKQKLFQGTQQIYEQLNDPNINYSIYDCFDLMRLPEVLQNSWTCGNCKKNQSVQKRQEISEASDILIIHLKRFKADYRKIKTMIEYPVKGLEIDRWIEHKGQGQGTLKYDLYAVCLHTGTAEYGHYKAYCKHFVSQKWHQFDDGNVNQIEEAKVVTPHAYMLFYKRVIPI